MTAADRALAAFLSARLDEDEAAAKAATPGPWIVREGQPWLADNVVFGQSDWAGHIQQACNTDHAQHKTQNAAHIARHDPARVLREVEAGRRILERHRPDDYGCQYCCQASGSHCPDLADLLYRWAGHPDYRQEWKP